MKRKVIIPIVLLIALAVAAGVMWSGWLHRDHGNSLMVSGNIELTQVDISFKVPGKLVERTVDEGAAVTKGMLIARIDRDQVDWQHSRDEAGLRSAQSQFQQTETLVHWQRATLDSDIALKKAQI